MKTISVTPSEFSNLNQLSPNILYIKTMRGKLIIKTELSILKQLGYYDN